MNDIYNDYEMVGNLVCLTAATGAQDAILELFKEARIYLKVEDISGSWNDDNLSSIFEAYQGFLLLRAGSDEEKALALLQSSLKPEQPCFEFVEREVQMFNFHKARKAKALGDLEGAQRYVNRLSQFVGAANSRDATIILASWERCENRVDAAKKLLQPAFAVAIDMLTDDTDENDEDGWSKLIAVLLAIGDTVNGVAALSFYEQLNVAQETIGQSDYTCDGCAKSPFKAETYYHCGNCIDLDLCEDCYGLVKEDKLGQNICGSSHELFPVPPIDKIYPAGEIKVDGQFVKIESWLEQLKKQFEV
jgi:hypothetical protein